jgi:hypothetical protein
MSPGCLARRRTGKWMALVGCGSSQPFGASNQAISVFFYNNREGPLQALLRRSISISHIMESGDTCPQGTSNARHVATLAGLGVAGDECTTARVRQTASGEFPDPLI